MERFAAMCCTIGTRCRYLLPCRLAMLAPRDMQTIERVYQHKMSYVRNPKQYWDTFATVLERSKRKNQRGDEER